MGREIRNLEAKAIQQRPRGKRQARAWADKYVVQARSAWAKRFVGTAMTGREVRRAERLSRLASAARGVEHAWHETGKAPRGFRRGGRR